MNINVDVNIIIKTSIGFIRNMFTTIPVITDNET